MEAAPGLEEHGFIYLFILKFYRYLMGAQLVFFVMQMGMCHM